MKKLLFLYSFFLLTSCTNGLFNPSEDVIDSVNKKGQLSMGFGVQNVPTSNYNFGGVYSPVNNLSVSLIASDGNTRKVGLGLGVYKNIGNSYLDFYFGLSKGNNRLISNYYDQDYGSQVNFNVIAHFNKPFFQLGYHIKRNRFIHDINLKYDNYQLSRIRVISERNPIPFVENLRKNKYISLSILSYRLNYNTELCNFYFSSHITSNNDEYQILESNNFYGDVMNYITWNFGATYRLDLKK